MKKQTILIAIFTLFSLISFGQKKMIEKAKKAFEYYENGEKLKAVKIFEELIVEYPNKVFPKYVFVIWQYLKHIKK